MGLVAPSVTSRMQASRNPKLGPNASKLTRRRAPDVPAGASASVTSSRFAMTVGSTRWILSLAEAGSSRSPRTTGSPSTPRTIIQ